MPRLVGWLTLLFLLPLSVGPSLGARDTKGKDDGSAKFVDVYQVWSTLQGPMAFYSERKTKEEAEKVAAALRMLPKPPEAEVRGPLKRPVKDKSKLFAIILQRESLTDEKDKNGNALQRVNGNLSLNGASLGTFYENKSKLISAGTYRAKLRYESPAGHAMGKGGKLGTKGDFLIELIGSVPGEDGKTHSAIQFHQGNKAEHSNGCFLLGPISFVNGEKIAPPLMRSLRLLFYDGEDDPKMSPDKTITVEIKDIPPPPPKGGS